MIPSTIILATIAALAIVVAAGLRRLGLKSEGLVAGLIVGVLAGPTIAGRIAPGSWTELVLGATKEREALQAAVAERRAFETAARSSEIAPESMATELARRDESIAARQAVLDGAEVRHARPWIVATVAFAVGAFWLGWATGRPAGEREPRPSPAESISLAIWVTLLPAFLVILIFRLLGRPPTDPVTLTVAACVAIPGWPVAGLDARRLQRCGVRRLVLATATLGSVIAGLLAGTARFFGGPAWALVALPLAVFRFGSLGRRVRSRVRGRRILTRVLVPVLTAFAVSRTEVLLETPLLATLALILVAGDGRGIAWLVGLRFCGVGSASTSTDPGRHADSPTEGRPGSPPDEPRPAWTTAMLASDAAGSQLALASLAVALGGLDPGLAFGVILAATVCDLFGPLRRRLASPGDWLD